MYVFFGGSPQVAVEWVAGSQEGAESEKSKVKEEEKEAI